MRRGMWMVLGTLSVLLVSCAGDAAFAPLGGAAAGGPPGELLADEPEAASLLGELRARWQLEAPAGVGAAPAGLALFAPTPIEGFARGGERIEPRYRAGARGARVSLPARGDGAFHVADERGMSIEVRLRGAQEAEAETAAGHVIYRGAAPGGGHVIHRVGDDGTEDYLSFDAPPPSGEIVYDVALGGQVAGLRLVADSLELLDAGGAPRLRVAPPFAIGADGRAAPGSLRVEGCAVDESPVAPWGRPVIAPGARACAVHVTFADGALAYPALVDPSWTSTASMAVPRSTHTTTRLGSGLVLAAGGRTSIGAVTATAELYNPTPGTWAMTGSLGGVRHMHTATLLATGDVLVAGGIWTTGISEETSYLNTAARYNAGAGTWTASTMVVDRVEHAAALLGNGKVLVAGGANAGGPLNSAELYNPATNMWAAAGNMAVYRSQHTATSLADGKALVAGNLIGSGPSSEVFDPATNTFGTGRYMITRRIRHAAVRLADGKVLVAGGYGPLWELSAGVVNQPLSRAEIYDPATSTWLYDAGSMSTARQYHTLTRLDDGSVLAAGGLGASGQLATVEVFRSAPRVWAPAPALPAGVSSHAAELLANGKVLATGGIVGNAIVADARLYDPATIAIASGEYSFPASLNPWIDAGVVTQVRARLYRPQTLIAGKQYPLVVFLHGAHPSCRHNGTQADDNDQYASMGTCPAGYSVIESHNGFGYIAEELARREYLVVSINAHRGIPISESDSTARANLVLYHLDRLAEWHSGSVATPAALAVDLTGHIDLGNIALVGHSRGGLGVRKANQFDPTGIKGVFEIAPSDTEEELPSSIVIPNKPWSVLLPMCDGDLASLEGMRPFDRMMSMTETTAAFKSTYTVFGANHAFYNTEWIHHDNANRYCWNHTSLFSTGDRGSALQRQTGLQAILAFVLGNVGPTADPLQNRMFDPKYPTPPYPRIDRGFIDGATAGTRLRLHEFTGAAGTSIAVGGTAATTAAIQLPEHDNAHRGVKVTWTAAGAGHYFQASWSAANLSTFARLDLRLDRALDALNPTAQTTFSVQLVTSSGLSAAVPISDFARLDGPFGSATPSFNTPHAVLQTARIPLSRFTGATLSSVSGVRLTFSGTASGAIYVANIRATKP